MKPDAYMRWYWNEFWQAVEGMSSETIVAYQRAISFYYHHNHAKGLTDDDEFLRRLCRIERDEWPQIRDTIFDNDRFFCQDANGLWHQKRAGQEWEKAVVDYKKATNRAKAGAKARWHGHA